MGRTTTRARGNGKRSQEGQYVPLSYAILKSDAWRSLSGAAAKVFLELHTRYNGGNNGNVRLSMNEAADALGIGKASAQRAFKELEAKGFIALAKPGNWYSRRAHEWRLTTKPMRLPGGSQNATNEWKTWRQKAEHGSETDLSASRMVPNQNPRPAHGSKPEPVRPESARSFGSEMEH